jgi:hypothetical protein
LLFASLALGGCRSTLELEPIAPELGACKGMVEKRLAGALVPLDPAWSSSRAIREIVSRLPEMEAEIFVSARRASGIRSGTVTAESKVRTLESIAAGFQRADICGGSDGMQDMYVYADEIGRHLSRSGIDASTVFVEASDERGDVYSLHRILLSLAAVETVSLSDSPTLEPARSGQAAADNPFEYYARCGDEWANLFDEWLSSGISGYGSLEQLYLASETDNKTALGSALQAAWSVERNGLSGEERRLSQHLAFFDSLAPLLTDGCSATSWMALALEGRDDTQWLMELASSELDLNPGDQDVATEIASALIERQTKPKNARERGSIRSR